MEIAESVLDFGAYIISGFVRDVIINGETTFHDIDIVCEYHKRDEFLEYLQKKWTTFNLIRSVSSVDIVYINDAKLDIKYYSTFEVWKSEDCSVDFTHGLFYISKECLGVQYVPEGYTFIELLNLVKQKRFKHLNERLRTKQNIYENIQRSIKFQERGWKLFF
jgi:hypothetical protein